MGSNGNATFADSNTDDLADLTAPNAQLTVVNGATAANGTKVTVKPVNGKITFTVDGVSYESVIPVVYVDEDSPANGLDLDADNAPTEAFGLGGVTNFMPQEAPTDNSGAPTTYAVDAAMTDDDAFIGTNGGNTYQFEYDSNDVYRVDGAQATMANFESKLTKGDNVDVTNYQRDAALVSTFELTNVGPATPAISST